MTYSDYPFYFTEISSEEFVANAQFLFYDGDTTLESIDLDVTGAAYESIVVKGNLIVTGNIYNENTDGAGGLIVLGNLQAQHIAVGGQCVYVTGSLNVEGVLAGSYNHGEMYVNGPVQSELIIADDYEFYFPGAPEATILQTSNEDDLTKITNALVPTLFNSDGGFNFFILYNMLKDNEAPFKPFMLHHITTGEDIYAMLSSPLLTPDLLQLFVKTDALHVSLIRAYVKEDGGLHNNAIFIADFHKNMQYYFEVDAGDVATVLKEQKGEWIVLEPYTAAYETWLQYFAAAQKQVAEKEAWNKRHIKNIDEEKVWALIAFFNPYADVADFREAAADIVSRVMYAANHPYAYIHGKYKTDSDRRRLTENPAALVNSAILDGLLQYQIIQEIGVMEPLGSEVEKLNALTMQRWDITYDINPYYQTNPIDKDFLRGINKALTAYKVGVLRLDMGIKNYLLTGLHVAHLDAFVKAAAVFDLCPRYFTFGNVEEENELKEIAALIEANIRDNRCRGLLPYYAATTLIWDYRYNEKGDVVFWENWFTSIGKLLTETLSQVDVTVEEDDFIFWWEWYKRSKNTMFYLNSFS